MQNNQKIDITSLSPRDVSTNLLTTIISKKQSKYYFILKRTLDIIISGLAILLLSPILLLLGIMYLFGESKGPLFYKQQRYGKNGKLFYMYKFRSMVVNADEKLKNNSVLYEKYVTNNYKLEQYEDPRITHLGRFMRKTSIDELPQLFNVFRGEMSLVGPRPIIEEELHEYKEFKDDFLSVKPGLTGYWQVNGRSKIGYPERVSFELYYVYNQSILLDLKIIFHTVLIVLLRKGAY